MSVVSPKEGEAPRSYRTKKMGVPDLSGVPEKYHDLVKKDIEEYNKMFDEIDY